MRNDKRLYGPRRFVLITVVVGIVVGTAGIMGACGSTVEGVETTTMQPSATEPAGTTASTQAATGVFKIGVGAPMTGQYGTYGADMMNGARIAVDQLNAAGGINGAEVQAIPGDDLGDPKEAVLVAQKFIDDKHVYGVSGHNFSGCTLAALPKYTDAQLPVIGSACTSPELTGASPYFWRICITDAQQGRILAKYAIDVLKANEIAILYDNGDYGTLLARGFQDAVKELGGNVVAFDQYGTGDADFKPQLTKIQKAGPSLVFLSGNYPEGWKIAQQARQLGMTATLLASDGFTNPDLMNLGGASTEGMLIATMLDMTSSDPMVQEFVSTYKAKFDTQPAWYAAATYDTFMIFAKAAAIAGKNDRVAINESIGKIGLFKGLTGESEWTEDHDVDKAVHIVEVKNGEFVTAPLQPSLQ